MGNIEMSSTAPIANEGWRAASHISTEYRRWLIKANCPPCATVPCDVGFMCSLELCPFKKFSHAFSRVRVKRTEIERQVDHTT